MDIKEKIDSTLADLDYEYEDVEIDIFEFTRIAEKMEKYVIIESIIIMLLDGAGYENIIDILKKNDISHNYANKEYILKLYEKFRNFIETII